MFKSDIKSKQTNKQTNAKLEIIIFCNSDGKIVYCICLDRIRDSSCGTFSVDTDPTKPEDKLIKHTKGISKQNSMHENHIS